MWQRIDSFEEFVNTRQLCSFGIIEAVAAVVGEIGADVGAGAAIDAGIGAGIDAGAIGAADAGAAAFGAADAGAALGADAAFGAGAGAFDTFGGLGLDAAAAGGVDAAAAASLGLEGGAFSSEAAAGLGGLAGADVGAAVPEIASAAGTAGGAAAGGAGLGGFVGASGAADLTASGIGALTGPSALGGADAGLAGGFASAADLAAPASAADISGLADVGAAGSELGGAGGTLGGLSADATGALGGDLTSLSGVGSGASELSAAPVGETALGTAPEAAAAAPETGLATGGNIAAGGVPGGLGDVNAQFAVEGSQAADAGATGPQFAADATSVASDAPVLPATDGGITFTPIDPGSLPAGTIEPPGGFGYFSGQALPGGIPPAAEVPPVSGAVETGDAAAAGGAAATGTAPVGVGAAASIPSSATISSIAGAPLGAAAASGAVGASLLEQQVGSSATGTIGDVIGTGAAASTGRPGIAAANSESVASVAQQNGWANNPGSTFTPSNIDKLLSQESGGKNLPPNQYGYTGYFQMRPSEFGLTAKDFAGMSFSQQLDLYSQYLQKNGYNGTQDLGVMNAAPAYANSPGNTIAYPAGSAAANANPQWVRYSNANGAVTVDGIKAWFAAGNGGAGAATQVAGVPPLEGSAPLGQGGIGSDVGTGPVQNSAIETVPVQTAALPAAVAQPGTDTIAPTSDTWDMLLNGKQLTNTPLSPGSNIGALPQAADTQLAGPVPTSLGPSPLEGVPTAPVAQEGLPEAVAATPANPLYGFGDNPAVATDAATPLEFAGNTPNVPLQLEGGFPGATSPLGANPVTPVTGGESLEAPVEPPVSGGGIGSDYAASGGTGPSANYADSVPSTPPTPAQPPAPATVQEALNQPPTGQGGIGSDAVSGGTAGQPASQSLSEWWKGLSPVARSAITASPGLIVAGINLARGPQNQDEEQALEAQAAQDTALYNQEEAMVNSGQIPPDQALQIEDWLKNQKNQINQEYAAMDRYQSTERLESIQNAQNTADAQFQADLQAEVTTAGAAYSQAATDLANAAKIQAANDAAFSSALISALGGIGKVGATALISSV